MSKRFHDRKHPVPLSVRDRLLRWMVENGKNRLTLRKFLEIKGLLLTQKYVNKIVNGEEEPGRLFISLFHEATGIRLVPGLIVTNKEE